MANPLGKFMLRDNVQMWCYFHVQALQRNGFSISIDEAIGNFLHIHASLICEQYTFEALRTAYFRINKDYLECIKTQ